MGHLFFEHVNPNRLDDVSPLSQAQQRTSDFCRTLFESGEGTEEQVKTLQTYLETTDARRNGPYPHSQSSSPLLGESHVRYMERSMSSTSITCKRIVDHLYNWGVRNVNPDVKNALRAAYNAYNAYKQDMAGQTPTELPLDEMTSLPEIPKNPDNLDRSFQTGAQALYDLNTGRYSGVKLGDTEFQLNEKYIQSGL